MDSKAFEKMQIKVVCAQATHCGFPGATSFRVLCGYCERCVAEHHSHPSCLEMEVLEVHPQLKPKVYVGDKNLRLGESSRRPAGSVEGGEQARKVHSRSEVDRGWRRRKELRRIIFWHQAFSGFSGFVKMKEPALQTVFKTRST